MRYKGNVRNTKGKIEGDFKGLGNAEKPWKHDIARYHIEENIPTIASGERETPPDTSMLDARDVMPRWDYIIPTVNQHLLSHAFLRANMPRQRCVTYLRRVLDFARDFMLHNAVSRRDTTKLAVTSAKTIGQSYKIPNATRDYVIGKARHFGR